MYRSTETVKLNKWANIDRAIEHEALSVSEHKIAEYIDYLQD